MYFEESLVFFIIEEVLDILILPIGTLRGVNFL